MIKFKFKILCFSLLLFFDTTSFSWALQRIDRLTGINQSYKAGYTLRDQSETFHETSVQEFVLEEEGKAEYEEGEAEPYEEDLWQYRRTFEIGTLYNTNAKGLSHDPTGDLIYTFAPTVGMSRKSEHTVVDLTYGLTHVRNAQDEEASVVSHQLTTEVGYLLDGLRLTFSDDFSPRSVLARGERTELAVDNASQDSVFAFSNAFKIQLAYPLTKKTEASFVYSNIATVFPSRTASISANKAQSDMVHVYNPRITYKVTPKFSVFGDYKREIRDFFEGNASDSRAHTIQTGFAMPALFKTKLTASGGYFIRDYRSPGTRSSIGCVYTIGIAKPLTRKIAVSLFSSQEIGENLDLRTSPSPKTVTTLFGYNLSYFINQHLSLQNNATAGFLEKTGSITKTDPENPTRTLTRPNVSDTYVWGLGLAWNPRPFFSAFAGYDYVNQKAPFNSSETKTHRFAVSGAINF